MSSLPQLRVLPSPDEVARAAAEEIVRVLGDAIRARGVAHWATTGGSAAPPVYRLLGEAPLREALDWDRVHVWWGDDRYVPIDHPMSNVLPLEQSLLARDQDESGLGALASVADHVLGVHIPAEHIHPIPMSAAIGHGTGVVGAAAAYAGELADGVPAGADGLPAFDLIWLGVGPDGHILSVFPGSAVWDAGTNVAPVPAPTHVEPHVERVTIHPRLLAAAREVLVVTTGEGKAANLARAWTGDDVRELPVRAARRGNAVWILDAAAAAGLTLP
jgi:6-phosphogluconolactonase